ncbi:hypothetical protein [Halobacteriovorax sp. HLS]|uniref:hypothetical protein n=1 Tax=Halobacteriovorax sp. HLS TaxID=2234000 RepID=UPI000FD9B98B|nr:hypothetical protein [Halobacteriovorax sp. HLS]
MKLIIASTLLLSCMTILACPNLDGLYFCQTSMGEVSQLELQHEVSNGVTSYIFKDMNEIEGRWIVDGKLRSLNSSPMDGVSNLKYRAKCINEELSLYMTGDLPDFNDKIKMNVSLYLDSSKNLVQKTSGQFSDGTPLPEVLTVCHRGSFAKRKK